MWKEQEQREAQEAVDKCKRSEQGLPEPAPKKPEDMEIAEARYHAVRAEQARLAKQGPSG